LAVFNYLKILLTILFSRTGGKRGGGEGGKDKRKIMEKDDKIPNQK